MFQRKSKFELNKYIGKLFRVYITIRNRRPETIYSVRKTFLKILKTQTKAPELESFIP